MTLRSVSLEFSARYLRNLSFSALDRGSVGYSAWRRLINLAASSGDAILTSGLSRFLAITRSSHSQNAAELTKGLGGTHRLHVLDGVSFNSANVTRVALLEAQMPG